MKGLRSLSSKPKEREGFKDSFWLSKYSLVYQLFVSVSPEWSAFLFCRIGLPVLLKKLICLVAPLGLPILCWSSWSILASWSLLFILAELFLLVEVTCWGSSSITFRILPIWEMEVASFAALNGVGNCALRNLPRQWRSRAIALYVTSTWRDT